ncbi:MAG: ribokinase [Verrucomicrobiota bacterium]
MSSSRPKKFDVVVLGGINTDYIIRGDDLPRPGQTIEGDSFQVHPGGKGANQAVAAARLGAEVAFIGRVGVDERGTELLKRLKEEGIDVQHVTQDKRAPTGAAIIAIDKLGEKQISAAPGANQTMNVRQIRAAADLIASAKVLLMQFESPMDCVCLAARIARKHGVKIVLDPAPARRVPKELFYSLDVIRPNSDEAEQITGRKVHTRDDAQRAARALLKKGVRIVAIEAGDGGDLIATEEEEIYLPRLRVKTVDATGAGDAFAGAFAVGLAEELPLRQIGRLANATAALSTTKIGAQEALPKRKAVEQLIGKLSTALKKN